METVWRYDHVSWYLSAVKKARASLAAGRQIKMHWNSDPLDAEGFRREFVKALHRRITKKVDPMPRGRKDSYEYQTHAFRDQSRLKDMARRICVYQFETEECNRRFGDRLSRYDD